MKVKWSNIALVALVLIGIWVWKRVPAPRMPPHWEGPYADAYNLAFWAMILVAMIVITKILMMKQ